MLESKCEDGIIEIDRLNFFFIFKFFYIISEVFKFFYYVCVLLKINKVS